MPATRWQNNCHTQTVKTYCPTTAPPPESTCDPCMDKLISKVEELVVCGCKPAPLPLQVFDSGVILPINCGSSQVTFAIAQGTRDLILRNYTGALARVTLPTGFILMLPLETLVLSNTQIEPSLQPFSAFTSIVSFTGDTGEGYFAVNFRVF
jgi:hypothetical protein